MWTHTSSVHVIRLRHPDGVFTCESVLHPSNNYVEYIIAFSLSVVLYHCFYDKLLKCFKCGCYVCKPCLSCDSIKNIYRIRELHMLQLDFGVILIHCFFSLSLRWICKSFAFTFKSAKYVKYLLIHFFQWEQQGEGVVVKKLKRWSNQQTGSHYISFFVF